MKMTFQPKKRQRARVHGFRSRMSTAGGRKVLAARRLKGRNRDFQNVYNNGKSYANRLLVMYIYENHTQENRLGISVSKKVGNSVIRHHLTRLIRESYRLHEDVFNSGLDIVVIARATARNASYHEVESALMHLGRLHKIVHID